MTFWFIREATEDDAKSLFLHMAAIAHEPNNNTSVRLDTLPPSLDALRDQIRQLRSRPNSLLLVVEYESEIIAMLRMTGEDNPLIAHNTYLSINIRNGFRGQGIGTDLLQMGLAWAKANPVVRRVELEAMPRNASAIRLYERMGFVHEGVRKQSYLLPDEGTYVDAVMMAYYLQKDAAEVTYDSAA
jgi:RimJ/RimL family protein N-acetyltransferase